MLQVSYSVPPVILIYDGSTREAIAEAAGQGALEMVRRWYRTLPADYFDGLNHPDGRPRTFAHQLGNFWELANVTENSATIRFSATTPPHYGLALHQYGGTIVPKKAKALTIPVDPQAHGLSVKGYATSIHKIFFVRKVDAPDADYLGSLCYKDPTGALHAAFVLRKRATIKPLKERRGHDALPATEGVAAAARTGAARAVKRLIES